MTVSDILIIVILITGTYIGFCNGAVRQLLEMAGLLLGLWLGVILSQALGDHVHSTLTKHILPGVICGVLCIGFLSLSMWIGRRIRVRKILLSKAYKLDKYSGLVVGAIRTILFLWITALLLLNVSKVGVQNVVLQSRIISYISGQTVFGEKVSSDFYFFVPDHSLSTDNLSNESITQPTTSNVSYDLPTTGQLVSAVKQDYRSVVFVQWGGCGEIHSGSGYVAAPQVVVTAAHVVSGSGTVSIEDGNHDYEGTVILYDTKHDVAAIYVPGLQDYPLKLDTKIIPTDTMVVAMGYPGGSPVLQTSSGIIQAYNNLAGLGAIVGAFGNSSMFYEISANLSQGSSGGPVVIAGGNVIGDISAAPSGANGDYVNSVGSYYNELTTSEKKLHRVSTGDCVS